MYSKWLILVLLFRTYPGAASLSTRVMDTRAITKSNGDKESPWNIPLLIDTLASCLNHSQALSPMFSWFESGGFWCYLLFLAFAGFSELIIIIIIKCFI